MTNPQPNQPEPSREQVEITQVDRVLERNIHFALLAASKSPHLLPEGPQLAKMIAEAMQPERSETEKLRLEREADMRSFNEAAKFSTELIASLQQQLAAASEHTNCIKQAHWEELRAERDTLRAQLTATQAEIEQVKAELGRANQLLENITGAYYEAGRNEHLLNKRILELESQCAEKDEALKEARKHLVFDKQGAGLLEAGALDRAISQIDAALTTEAKG